MPPALKRISSTRIKSASNYGLCLSSSPFLYWLKNKEVLTTRFHQHTTTLLVYQRRGYTVCLPPLPQKTPIVASAMCSTCEISGSTKSACLCSLFVIRWQFHLTQMSTKKEEKKEIRTASWNTGFFRIVTPRTWSESLLQHILSFTERSHCAASSEALREKTCGCGSEAELGRLFPRFFELLCSDLRSNAYKIGCWIIFRCFFEWYVVEQENEWKIGLGRSCLFHILLLT